MELKITKSILIQNVPDEKTFYDLWYPWVSMVPFLPGLLTSLINCPCAGLTQALMLHSKMPLVTNVV